jgi:RNA polymerase subunit RPABC4/transcription elongation factor Spt4
MTQDRNRPRVISPVAYFLSGLWFVIGFALVRYAAMAHDPKMAHWPEIAKLAFSIAVPLVCAAWILLLGYIYGDAKRRNMRYVMWTLLAIFIPDAIGIILYFVLRDPLPAQCPGCGTLVNSKFTFCPNCSAPLRPTCTQCGRPVERGWKHCPNCGAATPAANQFPVQAADMPSGPIQT